MKPLETTGEIVIDGDLIETANLVFHPVPKGECCRSQHGNTKNAILKRIAERISIQSVTSEYPIMSELTELAEWIDQLKLEDTK